jgi:hypothetical protein
LHNDYESKDSVPKKVNLFVSLRGLDAKKNWLAVNFQSYGNSDWVSQR